jgi:hypothetical protein
MEYRFSRRGLYSRPTSGLVVHGTRSEQIEVSSPMWDTSSVMWLCRVNFSDENSLKCGKVASESRLYKKSLIVQAMDHSLKERKKF